MTQVTESCVTRPRDAIAGAGVVGGLMTLPVHHPVQTTAVIAGRLSEPGNGGAALPGRLARLGTGGADPWPGFLAATRRL